ncbi:hybrid sensor histidine kinase/response regulator [Methylobacterium sp. ID0610]|uniref:hybrid sensor histidine kinase/response regulator n=1 Tax=Methylobacterium carpenticola TaxID=3344827 RepID=UPI0036B950EA
MPLSFFSGGGETGDLVRSYDWTSTSLGAAESWPQSLRTTVSTLLLSPVPIVLLWGEDGIMIYNDAYSVFAGGRHPRLLGSKVREGWPEVADFNDNVMRVGLAGGTLAYKDQELTLYRHGRPEQVWMNLDYSPVLDEEGEPAGVLCILAETTERVAAERRRAEAEAAVRESEGRFRALVNASSDVVYRMSPDWTEMRRLDGRGFLADTEEPSVLWIERYIFPEDRPRVRAAIDEAVGTRRAFELEHRVRRMDGSAGWTFSRAIPVLDGGGRVVEWFGAASDITERRNAEAALAELNATLEVRVAERTAELQRAEEALRQSQKLEAIGQLTGGVAHDFNNLLTVIKSSTDLLKRPDLAPERRERYVAAISDTVDRAARLTGQLLAFARRQALKPEVFAVCDSVRALFDMIGTLTGSRIRIMTRLPPAPCFVSADPSQFDTALVNMAVNARDAMDGEGELTISVGAVDQIPALRAHPAVPGAFVAVSIADTGSGIPRDRLEQIFEPFFTTKGVGQGTGLGLSQVIGFAKQSGGEVMVESEVGRGTTFTLYLPRVVDGVRPSDDSAHEPLMDGHGMCVLVVEDNPDVGTFAVQTLSDLGYRTVLAATAEEALTELATDAARFDVVFSDVVMPGMNGIDLAREIRRQHHDLPVLLASGYSHVLAQNGTCGFELLQKPYSVEQLSRLLRKVATWQRRARIMSQ